MAALGCGPSSGSRSHRSSLSGVHGSRGWKRRLSRGGSFFVSCRRRSMRSMRARSCEKRTKINVDALEINYIIQQNNTVKKRFSVPSPCLI